MKKPSQADQSQIHFLFPDASPTQVYRVVKKWSGSSCATESATTLLPLSLTHPNHASQTIKKTPRTSVSSQPKPGGDAESRSTKASLSEGRLRGGGDKLAGVGFCGSEMVQRVPVDLHWACPTAQVSDLPKAAWVLIDLIGFAIIITIAVLKELLYSLWTHHLGHCRLFELESESSRISLVEPESTSSKIAGVHSYCKRRFFCQHDHRRSREQGGPLHPGKRISHR